MFPKNASMAHQALLNWGSRACEHLSHLINLDRQHWETSNLHDNQKRTQAAGHLFMFNQIFSPSVKINVTQFRLIFLCRKNWSWLKNCLLVMCLCLVSNKWTWFMIYLFAWCSCLGTEKLGLKLYYSPCSLHSISGWMGRVSTDWTATHLHFMWHQEVLIFP